MKRSLLALFSYTFLMTSFSFVRRICNVSHKSYIICNVSHKFYIKITLLQKYSIGLMTGKCNHGFTSFQLIQKIMLPLKKLHLLKKGACTYIPNKSMMTRLLDKYVYWNYEVARATATILTTMKYNNIDKHQNLALVKLHSISTD